LKIGKLKIPSPDFYNNTSSNQKNDMKTNYQVPLIEEELQKNKISDEETKKSLRIKAKNDQATRYFKALREIEFIMVRI
jgi:hypothetical protein